MTVIVVVVPVVPVFVVTVPVVEEVDPPVWGVVVPVLVLILVGG